MSTTDNYRSLADSLDQSPMLSDEAGGDQGLTISLPSVTNPSTLSYDPASSGESTGGTQLVAYQETLPTPPAQDGDDAFKDDATRDDADSGDARASESKTLVGAERVGERPEDNTLQFLRTQTVLLEPGESQCDIGINYLFSENRFPILLLDNGVPVGTDDVLFRIRELTIPLEYRVGLLKRVQGFIGAPIGWSNTQVAIGDYEQFQNDGGFHHSSDRRQRGMSARAVHDRGDGSDWRRSVRPGAGLGSIGSVTWTRLLVHYGQRAVHSNL
jgi:hypothetical protein